MADLQNSGKDSFYSIVVVDDGSGAEYADIFSSLKKNNNNINLLSHAINMGKGAALKTGFNFILTHYPNVKSIITADADGQHLAEDILKIAEQATHKPNTLILGARQFSDSEIPLRSRVGNQLTRKVMRFFTGLKLTDTQTGLRAWPTKLCLHSLNIASVGYDFEMDALLMSKQLFDEDESFSIIEVPIQTIYDKGNTSSHFSPVWDSMKIYFIFFRYCSASFMTVIVDYIFFSMLLFLSSSIAIAMICGRLAATIVSFLLNRKFVFQSSAKDSTLEFLKFIATVAFLGLIAYLAIAQLASIGVNVYIAKFSVEITLFFASFSILNNLVFKKGK
jgi:glycosyltransferase involved in cell wall biosynthesis